MYKDEKNDTKIKIYYVKLEETGYYVFLSKKYCLFCYKEIEFLQRICKECEEKLYDESTSN